MKRIQRWQPHFVIWPRKVSGKWTWLRRVMRKGDQYVFEYEYDKLVNELRPSAEQIAKLTPYTADEILEGDTDER